MSVRDIILRGLLLGPLILLLIGCNALQSDNDNEQGGQATMTAISQDPDYGEEVLYSASRGGQITLQGDPMRIGIAGVNEGSYTDEEGNAQSGPFVALALFMRDTPELDRNVTVGEGQIIYQGDFRLRVTDVQVDDQFVVIKVATKRDSSQ